MKIYVFDGMSVYSYDHELEFSSLINEERSSSWLFENPLRNIYGWEPGWRNASDFDEILPMRADDVTPCYLPKNQKVLSSKYSRINSLTHNLKSAQFAVVFK